MDVGNAFIMGEVATPEEIVKYSTVYFKAHDKKVRAYNKRLEEIISNLPEEARKQFLREDLCRKSARGYLKPLAEIVHEKVAEAVKAKAIKRNKDGRINAKLKKSINDAFKVFVKEYSTNQGTLWPRTPQLSDQDKSYLEMFKDNVIRFFQGLQTKNEYLWGGAPDEQEDARFGMYWEGMLASMAYKAMRNVRAYSGFILGLEEAGRHAEWGYSDMLTETSSDINPAKLSENKIDMVNELEKMTSIGIVCNIEQLLAIYESKLAAGTVKHPYSVENYESIRQMNEELKNLAGCFGKLGAHMETQENGI
jgi:hypothetical protein